MVSWLGNEDRKMNPGALILVLGLIIMGVCGVVNRIAKRPVANGGMIAFVLSTLAAGWLFALIIPKLPMLPPEAQGQMVGTVIGTFLIPWLVFGSSWNSFNKKKAQHNKD